MNIKKHVGRLLNTDRRVAVVFMQIPGRDTHALVVDTDALPDSYHDALMGVIDSVEGQQTPTLANILNRRVLPDTGQDIMTSLHVRGFLQAQPVENIIMFPRPNTPMPLTDIIKMMSQTPEQARADVETARDRFQETMDHDSAEKNRAMAMNLVTQARDLQAEANRKLEQAYDIDPSLRPQVAAPLPMAIEEDMYFAQSAKDAVVAAQLTATRNDFNVDVGDLPTDVAQAFVQALKEDFQKTPYVEADQATDAAHGIDVTDERTQAFLDRAAFREDKEAKAVEPQVKRPVGRPKKAK